MRRSLTLAPAFVVLLTAQASATIVWEGKVVRAWPDLPVGQPRPADDNDLLSAAPTNVGLYPHPKGVVWGLTLLVDFSDQAPAFDKTKIDAWLNQRNYTADGLNGSVRDYFFDQSNGQVDFQNQIFGFYRAKNPKSYYEGGSGYQRSDELWSELIAAVDAEVDFSKFDNDKDGRTEAISVVYAGSAVTFAQGLWPHASGSNLKKDGVTLSRYMMSALEQRPGLYTFCHECGHMLFGWPDLYGFGNYCIMGNSSSQTNPVGINDVYRADQGWIPFVDINKDTNATYSATPNQGGFRYLNPARPKESFFWSNVANTGRWSSLRGRGLLVFHFDNTIASNTPPGTLGLAVVQADGKNDLGATMWPDPGSDAADFFGGTKNELSGTTMPATRWNNGSASDLRIYNISAPGDTMTFSVGQSAPPADAGVIGQDAGRAEAGATNDGPGPDVAGTGGVTGSGGRTGTAGTTGSGGRTGTGGATNAGGTTGGGGTIASGGVPGSGGTIASGGAPGSGGTIASGGVPASGGGTASGGSMPGGGITGGADGGCGCQQGGSSPTSSSPLLLVVAALVLRRRRSSIPRD